MNKVITINGASVDVRIYPSEQEDIANDGVEPTRILDCGYNREEDVGFIVIDHNPVDFSSSKERLWDWFKSHPGLALEWCHSNNPLSFPMFIEEMAKKEMGG